MLLAAARAALPVADPRDLVGGAIAAGSANSINMYLDRDIDAIMRRTRQRPLPSHAIEPEHALRFGFVLGAIAFYFLAVTVNVLAAVLALSAIAFYVFVYTMWLKRTTAQNIVIGGAAGAVPALVGWAAVTGTLARPAVVLFAIVFVWTPPHFWALAMRFSGDYAAAGVPMLPVVRGEDETRRQILLYSLVLFATTLLLVPVGNMGPVYMGAAVCAGARSSTGRSRCGGARRTPGPGGCSRSRSSTSPGSSARSAPTRSSGSPRCGRQASTSSMSGRAAARPSRRRRPSGSSRPSTT